MSKVLAFLHLLSLLSLDGIRWIRIPSCKLKEQNNPADADDRSRLASQSTVSVFPLLVWKTRLKEMSLPQPIRCSTAAFNEVRTRVMAALSLSCCFLLFITISASSSSSSPSILRGVHPLDVKYFGSDLIKCKDGSKSFRRDRVNDDFCDCADGTDEPGTSACASGKFYCRNLGSRPRFLFSSHVNDHICDCCDGSDEYDGAVYCPNTCVIGAGIAYKAEFHHTNSVNGIQAKESKQSGKLDVIQNLKDLWIVLLIQLMVIIYILVSWLFYNRKSRKRRNR